MQFAHIAVEVELAPMDGAAQGPGFGVVGQNRVNGEVASSGERLHIVEDRQRGFKSGSGRNLLVLVSRQRLLLSNSVRELIPAVAVFLQRQREHIGGRPEQQLVVEPALGEVEQVPGLAGFVAQNRVGPAPKPIGKRPQRVFSPAIAEV